MSMKAFYLIDKPKGITSFDVLRELRKKLQIRKMWHTGTLDPLATGALLVAIGNYTKLIPYFEKDIKEYTCSIALDGVTPSYDSETDVEYIWDEKKQYFEDNLRIEKIQEIIDKNFTWEINQVPPKYSALKIWGKKALDIVRSGWDVEMKTRKAYIYEAEILGFEYPVLKCRFKVSAGTYIRSIAHDLWQITWSGAYITQLRRTKIGNLDISLAQNLDDFYKEKKLDIKNLFWEGKFIELDQKVIERMNVWLETLIPKLQVEDGEYFVKKEGEVINIVSYERPLLKAKKRII